MQFEDSQKILDIVQKVYAKLEKCVVAPRQNRSEQLNELFAALSKAQGQYSRFEGNRRNSFFKSNYADLESVLHSVREPLEKNGLCFSQIIEHPDDGALELISLLGHSSGQWISTRQKIVFKSTGKNDHQDEAAAITYKRRQAAMALLGVAPANDLSDDDAESLNNLNNPDAQAPNNSLAASSNYATDIITKEQLDMIRTELGNRTDIGSDILRAFKITSLAHLPKEAFQKTIDRIRKIKAEGPRAQ